MCLPHWWVPTKLFLPLSSGKNWFGLVMWLGITAFQKQPYRGMWKEDDFMVNKEKIDLETSEWSGCQTGDLLKDAQDWLQWLVFAQPTSHQVLLMSCTYGLIPWPGRLATCLAGTHLKE